MTTTSDEAQPVAAIIRTDIMDPGAVFSLPAGALYFVVMFLPWHEVSTGTQTLSATGWEHPSAENSIVAAAAVAVTMLSAVVRIVESRAVPPALTIGIGLGSSLGAAACLVAKVMSDAEFLGIGFWLAVVAVGSLVVAEVVSAMHHHRLKQLFT